MPHHTTSSMTRQFVEDFLYAKIAQGLSTKTITTYRERLTRFALWLGDRPITRPVLRGYLAHLQDTPQLSPVTIAAYFRDVAIFCRWLVEEGELDENPARKLQPRMPKRRPASYSAKHIQALLRVCDERDQAIILALCDTGLRVSELISLQRDSIDWATGHFTVIGKGNKERSGWFDDKSLNAILAYLNTRTDTSPALWYGRGRPLRPNGVHQAIKRRAIQAGIRPEVRRIVHAFRATFAKNYLKCGGDLKSLADLLGHSTLTMAAHYGQLADDELGQKKAAVNPLAAVLLLDELRTENREPRKEP